MFQNDAFRIETKRLILRCYEIVDAQALINSVEKNRDHLYQYMPWSREPKATLKEKKKLIREFIGKFYMNEDYTYAIFLKSGEFIGGTGLHTRRGKGILEIGYWICKNHLNKGYATELSYALTKVGLFHWNEEKIEIRHNLENLVSERIPKKLKFTEDSIRTELDVSKPDKKRTDKIWVMFKNDFKEKPSYEPIIMRNSLGELI